MMKNIFIILFSLIVLFSNAQNLTLDELMTLRKSNITEVKHYLTNKNWEFSRYKQGGNKIPNMYEFNYQNYISTVLYMEHPKGNTNLSRIIVLTTSDKKAQEYAERVLSFNPKHLQGKYDELAIATNVYQGATTTFIFESYQTPGSKSHYYLITILNNQDYNKNYRINALVFYKLNT
ncbi:hypothetical protein [Apibacter adventoris]|nr:hypothetical protein [Apibacter adventoris]